MDLLNKHDLDRAVALLPYEIKMIMSANGANIMLAGGYIRSVIAKEPIKDIDLFISGDREEAHKIAHRIKDYGYDEIHSTQHNFTLLSKEKTTVQVIHGFDFYGPMSLLNSFDFNICKAVIWYSGIDLTWQGLTVREFYQDLVAKRLTYTNPEWNLRAASPLCRVLKFYERGYTIDIDSFSAIITNLVSAADPRVGATICNKIAEQLALSGPSTLTEWRAI